MHLNSFLFVSSSSDNHLDQCGTTYLKIAHYHTSNLHIKDQKRPVNELLYYLCTFKVVDFGKLKLATDKTTVKKQYENLLS